jgi:hypothetical protein
MPGEIGLEIICVLREAATENMERCVPAKQCLSVHVLSDYIVWIHICLCCRSTARRMKKKKTMISCTHDAADPVKMLLKYCSVNDLSM